jgi:hypothetical protein
MCCCVYTPTNTIFYCYKSNNILFPPVTVVTGRILVLSRIIRELLTTVSG